MSDSTPPAQDFAATVSHLEAIVERLESGELSLEDALTAFEQGVTLTRDAQQRLDTAELKVRALSEDKDGQLEMAPFASTHATTSHATPSHATTASHVATPGETLDSSDHSEETPPW